MQYFKLHVIYQREHHTGIKLTNVANKVVKCLRSQGLRTLKDIALVLWMSKNIYFSLYSTQLHMSLYCFIPIEQPWSGSPKRHTEIH